MTSKEPIGINEAVGFEETSAAVCRLSFKAGSSKYVVIRGLRFFLRNEELFPLLLPYFHFDPEVANYPGVVRLSTPPSGGLLKDATSVQLRWQPTENAQEYLVQVDTVEGFCTPAFESQVDKTVTTVKIEQLDPNRLYYWRVKAINTDQDSSMGWSEIWKFKTPP